MSQTSCPHLAALLFSAGAGVSSLTSVAQGGRAAGVADAIEMTVVVAQGNPAATATFSPDGMRFFVVTRRGNLARNTNDYSILLFHSADAFKSPKPQILVTWGSASNNPAIAHVRWLNDNGTLVFQGEQVGQKSQAYALDIESRHVRRLTQSATDIVAFDATADLKTIAYLARQPITSMFDAAARARGLVIDRQRLSDLLSGYTDDDEWAAPVGLFVQRGGDSAKPLPFENMETPLLSVGVSLSPDGAYALIVSNTRDYGGPASWKLYRFARNTGREYLAPIIIDTRTGANRFVLGPSSRGKMPVWSADGRALIMSGAYLPLDVSDLVELEARRTHAWTVEVDAVSGAYTKIARGESAVPRSADRAVDIELAQSINDPPRVVAVDRRSGRKSDLIDLNPQFQSLEFGRVEKIVWQGSHGAQTTGGMYLPVNYVKGRRYPLVVQSHGWNPDRFEIEGIFTSGYAAQALAGHGFIVIQAADDDNSIDPAQEGRRSCAMYEGLIDHLNAQGLINPDRVGLSGFSRYGYAVRYMTAFSRYPIAAAVVTDGMDGGYWQYLTEDSKFLTGETPNLYEEQYGAAPYGKGLRVWVEKNPSFNLDKVRTPMRLLGFGKRWFKSNWEEFVGLRRLGKPVELVVMPDAIHQLVKPLERLSAAEGNVDWFRFWLQGEEDPSPEKREQYQRWRKLREMHARTPALQTEERTSLQY